MSKVGVLWARIRNSLWFLPSLLTATAVALAFACVQVDRTQLFSDPDRWFLFGAGASGARGVLGTIAGSIITVTGVVFSITILVLQLASSQFTPRVLQSFTQDRSNQLVLGTFIGTFTYSLLVLRTVRSSIEDRARFVPAFSVTVAVVLALVSVAVLIYFINHVARSIQAEVLLDRAAANARRVVDHLFPQDLGDPPPGDGPGPWAGGAALPAVVGAPRSGYLQVIDEEGVLRLAEREAAVVRMEARIGTFLHEGEPLFSVWPASVRERALPALAKLATLGPERTREQDLERSLVELTDIGVRALSPSLNDPTTAQVSIDRLGEVLARLATREFPSRYRAGPDGTVRFVARRSTFAEFVARAYRPLLVHARRDPVVVEHLEYSLERLGNRAPASRREPFRDQLRILRQDAPETPG